MGVLPNETNDTNILDYIRQLEDVIRESLAHKRESLAKDDVIMAYKRENETLNCLIANQNEMIATQKELISVYKTEINSKDVKR